MKRILPVVLAFCITATSSAFGQTGKKQLTPVEREHLRFALENIYNDVDLLLKNQASERADLKREEKELELFHVLDRIPVARTATDETLRPALEVEARTRALLLKSFQILKHSKPARPAPREVFADLGRFRLEDDHIVEEVRFVARVDGKAQDVGAWIASWKQEAARFAEPQGEPRRISSKGRGLWEVRGRAFRFRDIAFPRLRARDPLRVLPAWARNAPHVFESREPALWQLVTRARELIPRTPAPYERRGRFMLASQRMEFYIKKTEGESAPVAQAD